MNTKNKNSAGKGETKGVSRHRPPKDEIPEKPLLGDDKKKTTPVGRKGVETRPKRTTPVTNNGPSIQQKVPVAPTSWVKGSSSLSFADVVRKKAENAALNSTSVKPEEAVIVESPPDIQDEELINVQPLINETDDITYDAIQQDPPIVQDVLPPIQEEELEEIPSIKYYILEIDRVFEESFVLPKRATDIPVESNGTYIFSGQPGKPPTPPTAQIPQQFYRPDAAAPRSFGAMGGSSDFNRGPRWVQQPGHHFDSASVNWPIPDRNPRNFHQGIQYNSYGPPAQQQQQQQRNFPQTVNRMRHNEMSDVSLRTIRDSGAFNQQPGNGGGVW